MPPPVYFVQHLSGHDERLLGMHTRRIDLAHPAVTRIVAGLQPLDRIDLRTCLFDCHASLVLGLRHRIAEAEAAAALIAPAKDEAASDMVSDLPETGSDE